MVWVDVVSVVEESQHRNVKRGSVENSAKPTLGSAWPSSMAVGRLGRTLSSLGGGCGWVWEGPVGRCEAIPSIPIPSRAHSGDLVILVDRYSLRCGIPALASTAARVSKATGSSPGHKHSWRALPMPQRHSASHWRGLYQLSAPTETPRGYEAQQVAYQSTRRCLPQGRSEQPRRGAIASPHRDCMTIAS